MKNEHKMLYIVVKNNSVVHLRKIINEVDSDAFVVINNVKDVSGGTFFAGHNPPYETDERQDS
jgi:uncharacterized membrane-anchored protein YitT (DUF2179 family)